MLDEEKLFALISQDVNLRLVEPHVYSVYPPDQHAHSYDNKVTFYDGVIGNRFYNRLMWGYWPAEFAAFCHAALTSSTQGWVLDAACGSLVFTAKTFVDYSERPVVLLDQSIEMLRAAKSRLIKLKGDLPPNVVFLQGDVLQLPFKPKSFRTIISMNVLHILDDVKAMLRGFESALADGGAMSLTSLIANDRWGDIYLRSIHKAGEAASPRDTNALLAILHELDIPVKHYVKGNMMFIYKGARHLGKCQAPSRRR